LTDSEGVGGWVRDELDRIPGTPEEVRARHIQDLARGAVHTLGALAGDPSESAQGAVLGYFSKNGSSIRALQSVVAIAPTSTVQRLVERAGSSPEQKQALIDGLAARGDPTFARVLRAALRDGNDDIRRSALRGLVQLGDAESSGLLQEAARSTDPSERGFAALASDPDAGVASAALGQLQISAPELAATLAKRAYQAASAADRPTLLSSLSGLRGGLAMPLYELALQDSDENVVLSGVQSLAQLQGPDSAERLLAIASDANRSEEVRQSAAQALLALGGPLVRANRALLGALEPADGAVAEAYTCDAPSQ
jgi:HEAT repeat protein